MCLFPRDTCPNLPPHPATDPNPRDSHALLSKAKTTGHARCERLRQIPTVVIRYIKIDDPQDRKRAIIDRPDRLSKTLISCNKATLCNRCSGKHICRQRTRISIAEALHSGCRDAFVRAFCGKQSLRNPGRRNSQNRSLVSYTVTTRSGTDQGSQRVVLHLLPIIIKTVETAR